MPSNIIPTPLDIVEIKQNGPDPLDFIWDGFVAGSVGALVSPGGTGKSFFALEAAVAIAGGPDLLGLKPQGTGKVVYLAAEDNKPILTNRVYAILQPLNLEQTKIIAENLIIGPVLGNPINLMNQNHLREIIKEYGDSRLIIFDTISCFHTLDENSNSDMAQLINRLKQIVTQTGTTILFLHHTNKMAAYAGLTDQQQAARGASAIIDNIRWCGFLRKMTPKEANEYTDSMFGNRPISEERRGFYLKFGVSKGNYVPSTEERWLKREKGGVLVPVRLIPIVDNRKKAINYDKFARL